MTGVYFYNNADKTTASGNVHIQHQNDGKSAIILTLSMAMMLVPHRLAWVFQNLLDCS